MSQPSRRKLLSTSVALPLMGLVGCSQPRPSSDGVRVPITSVAELGVTSDVIMMGAFSAFRTETYRRDYAPDYDITLADFVPVKTVPSIPSPVLVCWQITTSDVSQGLDTVKAGPTYLMFCTVSTPDLRDDLIELGDVYSPTGGSIGFFAVDGDDATMIGAGFDAPSDQARTQLGRTHKVDDLFQVSLRKR